MFHHFFAALLLLCTAAFAPAPAAADPTLGSAPGGAGNAMRPAASQAMYREKVTFRVPVSLQKMTVKPGFVPVVTCVVRSEQQQTLGFGSEPVKLVGGAFSGMVRVAVTPTDGTFGAASHYRCSLGMRSLDGHTVAAVGPKAAKWAQPKAGTPFTKQVEGPLP